MNQNEIDSKGAQNNGGIKSNVLETISSPDAQRTCAPSQPAASIKNPEENKSAATEIVEAVIEGDAVELWHTFEENCFLSLRFKDGHIEHHAFKSKSMKQWLAGLYFARTGKAANSSAITSAMTVLEGYAMNGRLYQTYVRVAENNGTIYVDLANDACNVIKISSSGWEIIKNSPIKFLRLKGLKPLPIPERGGSIENLRSILNIEKNEQWLLIKGWLVGTLSPKGPFAILSISGEQGSAKTWLEKILKSTIDPNILEVRRPAKNTEDLMIAASNNWILTFDNLSRINARQSDDMCCLATGGGLAKRELYSDSDETIIRVCRPIILNGIEDIVTRQDLLDRSIILTMPRIPDDKRCPEADLIYKFEMLHPKILGSLLDMAVVGLQNRDTIVLDELPRMADFAKWVAAALGDEGSEFLKAYKANKDYAIKDSLEGEPIVIALREFIELKQGEWSGTATELLSWLNAATGYAYKRPPAGWPRAPNALGGALRRLAPALRKVGIGVEFSRDETAAKRIISITEKEIAV
jgi:hypothetical protein